MFSAQHSSRFLLRIFLTVFLLAGLAVILSNQQNANPQVIDAHEQLEIDSDSLEPSNTDFLNSQPVMNKKNEFIISDVVQKYVVGGAHVRMWRMSRLRVRGTMVTRTERFYFSAFGLPRPGGRGVKRAHIFFRRYRGRHPQFRAFKIVSGSRGTVIIVYPRGGAPIRLNFRRGSRLSRFKNSVFNRFLGSKLVGAFVKLDVKLGAAGFIGNKNAAVQGMTFFANTFAIRLGKAGKRRWAPLDQEYEKANHMVTAFQKLGRMPKSMDEALDVLAEEDDNEGSVKSRRRLFIGCLVNPRSCIRNRKRKRKMPKCPMRNACGNACLGRCGFECSCWKWMCGSCGCHCNCWNHDIYCSCIRITHPECVNMKKYSNCYQRCFKRIPAHKRPRQRRRQCWANGALTLAKDVNGNPIRMKDVSVTKKQIHEMQVIKPNKLMVGADSRWVGLPGRLVNVAISSLGTLYGVTRHQAIYTKRSWNRGHWIRLPGMLTQISVNNAGTVVTGVNRHNNIFYTRVNVHRLNSVRWNHVPGKLADVSSGGRFMYGVTGHDHVFRSQLMHRNWCHLPGLLVQISAHGRGVVGVNRHGSVYQYTGNGRWKYFRTPRARWASMGRDGDFWVITRNYAIYRMIRGQFRRMPGGLVQIDVADRRNIVGINCNDQIFQWV